MNGWKLVAGAKAKAKSKANARWTPRESGKGTSLKKEQCKFFLQGRCNFGDKCLRSHDAKPNATVAPTPKANAKGKAKAKAKSEPQSEPQASGNE